MCEPIDIRKTVLKEVYDLLSTCEVDYVANLVEEAICISKDNEQFYDERMGYAWERINELESHGVSDAYYLRGWYESVRENDLELLKAQITTDAYEEALEVLDQILSWND